MVKNPPGMWETWVQSLGWEDPLEEGMDTHSSILAWGIPKDWGAWQTAVHRVTENQTELTKHNTAVFCDMAMLHFDAHSQLVGVWLVSIFWLFMNHEHLCNVIISYCVFSFLLSMYTSGITGSCSNSNFCGTARWSSRVAAPFYIAPNDVWGFQFLHVFPISFIVLLFDRCPNGCGVSLWFLICLSPMSNNVN